MTRARLWFGAVLALSLVPASAEATRIFEFEGTTPDTNVDVRFTAELTIAGNNLTLVLTNDSLNHGNGASPTLNPNDLLTSFYFDIFNGVSRPTLTYSDATGDVCLTDKDAADDCSVNTNQNDLRAFDPGDDTWQFKSGLSLQLGVETLTFGVGTAGNNSLTPNGFNGNIVDGLDYGIYAGDITTQNLDATLLVKEAITFKFKGVSGFSENDIGDEVVFGLGTQPDSTGLVPEPGTGVLLGLGLAALAWRRRRS